MESNDYIQTRFQVHSKQGREYLCWCPWHDDDKSGKPNLWVNESKKVYHCWVCGAKGSLINLIEKGETLEISGVAIKQKIKNLREPEIEFSPSYPESWLRQFGLGHAYWKNIRGFHPRTIKKFQLGYDSFRKSGTIPVRDSHGKLQGVILRRLDGSFPKYVHPKGWKSGKGLFGSWVVRRRSDSKVALVEGPLDAIACWDASVPALAMFGSRLTPDQVKVLKSLNIHSVVVMTDNDDAGEKAVHQIKDALKDSGIYVLVGLYHEKWTAKDPGELTPYQRREMFQKALPYHEAMV